MNKLKIILFLILANYIYIFGQAADESRNSISISCGYEGMKLIDGLISPNEYSGGSVYSGLKWGEISAGKIVQIETSFVKNDNLKNNSSSAQGQYFSIVYRHLFFISQSPVFSKQGSFYLGPGVSVSYQSRKQTSLNIKSEFNFFSLNLNAMQNVAVSGSLDVFAQCYLSAFSYAVKSQSANNLKSLGIFSGLTLNNLEVEAGCRYKMSNLLNISLLYAFHYLKSEELEYYRMMEDKISFQLEMRF